MKWLAANWFRVGMLVIALIIAGSIGYYFVAYIPQRDQANRIMGALQQETVDAGKAATLQSFKNCMTAAQTNERTGWDNECAAQNLGSDCSLPEWNADRWDAYLQNQEDLCTKEYPL